MADIVLTTQEDWELGTVAGAADTEATPGDVVLDGGSTGTHTTHNVDGGADLTHWAQLRMHFTRPSGAVIRFRVRTAATEGELATAADSVWIPCQSPDGIERVDLDTLFANAGLTSERWLRVETYLRK